MARFSPQALSSSLDEFRGDASSERHRAKMKKMSRNNPHTGMNQPTTDYVHS
jgi:hypothetical protein